MTRVRNKDSKAELALRQALHRRGYRYRLHAAGVPGKPDIVFTKRRLAVFVDGDTWHGNEHGRRGIALEEMFPTNTNFWTQKICRNMERDKEVNAALGASGWHVVRLWESDILAAPEEAADRVVQALTVLDS